VLFHKRDDAADVWQRAGNVHWGGVAGHNNHRHGKYGRQKRRIAARATGIHMSAGEKPGDVALHGERRRADQRVADVAGVICNEKMRDVLTQFGVALFLNHAELGGERGERQID